MAKRGSEESRRQSCVFFWQWFVSRCVCTWIHLGVFSRTVEVWRELLNGHCAAEKVCNTGIFQAYGTEPWELSNSTVQRSMAWWTILDGFSWKWKKKSQINWFNGPQENYTCIRKTKMYGDTKIYMNFRRLEIKKTKKIAEVRAGEGGRGWEKMSGRAKIKVEEKTRVNGDKCGGEPWTEMSKQGRIGVYKKRT